MAKRDLSIWQKRPKYMAKRDLIRHHTCTMFTSECAPLEQNLAFGQAHALAPPMPMHGKGRQKESNRYRPGLAMSWALKTVPMTPPLNRRICR